MPQINTQSNNTIETTPQVRTMADDLAQSQQTPQSDSGAQQSGQSSTAPSPFLQQNTSASQKQPSPRQTPQTPQKKRSSIIPVLLIIVVLLVIVMAGAWYYLQNMQNADNVATVPNNIDIVEEFDVDTELPVIEEVLAPQPINQFALPVTSTTSAQDLRSQILQNITTQRQQGNLTPLEFTVTQDGAALTFATFAQQFLPLLPQNLLTSMNLPFTIYSVNNGASEYISITALTEDSAATNTILRQNETVLPEAVTPILFGTSLDLLEAPAFQDSIYRKIPTRFYTIDSTTGQSINYATHYEHVFFGAGSYALQTVMDTVFAQKKVIQNPVNILPIPAGPDESAAVPATQEVTTTTSQDATSDPAGGPGILQ
jgi:hypothetical protein